MKIKILGTRGEIPLSDKKHSLHSGVLVDDVLLLDVGEKKYLKRYPKCIFITHLHPDHAFFVREKNSFDDKVSVYAPEKSGNPEIRIKIIDTPVNVDSYLITPIPVLHSIRVKSVAYLVEKGKKKVLYTGDIASIKNSIINKLPKLDLVISEASFVRKGGLIRKNAHGEIFGHAGIPDIIAMFRNKTGRIIFTHFGSWFIRDVEAGREKIKLFSAPGLKTEAAYDGVEYEI